MSSFTEPLILEALGTVRGGIGEFSVYKPFTFDVGYEGSSEKVTVPAGYKTDLASIPFYARWLIPLSGPMAKPALVHDWLLEQEDPRAIAVFDEAMMVTGVSKLMRELVLAAVRFHWWRKSLWRRIAG